MEREFSHLEISFIEGLGKLNSIYVSGLTYIGIGDFCIPTIAGPSPPFIKLFISPPRIRMPEHAIRFEVLGRSRGADKSQQTTTPKSY
jgi:hypothetical protein